MLALFTGPVGLVPLGLLAVLAVAAWRWMDRRTARLGAPVRSIRLTHQHVLHVIDLDGRRLVIGTGPAAAPRLIEAGPTPPTETGMATEVTREEDPWTRS